MPHTPGLWSVREKESGNVFYQVWSDAEGEYWPLAELGCSERAKADARLMAAAPDLLAALKRIRATAAMLVPESKPHAIWTDILAADAAIAKAVS